MKFAIVDNNLISNIVELDSEEQIQEISLKHQTLLDISHEDPLPEIGWILRGNKLEDPSGGSVKSKIITKLAFLNRFTSTELVNMEGFASQSNPYAFALRAAMRKQALATFIDLQREDTISGTLSLVSLGLLTSERANIILTSEPTESEIYKGRQ
jgi:hypothetical protein